MVTIYTNHANGKGVLYQLSNEKYNFVIVYYRSSENASIDSQRLTINYMQDFFILFFSNESI